MVYLNYGMPGIHKGGKNFVSERISPKLKQEKERRVLGLMICKKQIKKTNLVSENRNLFFNMKRSVGVEHWCFLMFYDYEKRGEMLLLDFSYRWVVC
jgi:hypothetical protein